MFHSAPSRQPPEGVVIIRDGDEHPRTPHHHSSGETCCRGCGRVWSSTRQCHCTECHRQFGGAVTFENHRQHGQCLSDRTLGRRGLNKNEDRFGTVWGRSFPASTARSTD